MSASVVPFATSAADNAAVADAAPAWPWVKMSLMNEAPYFSERYSKKGHRE